MSKPKDLVWLVYDRPILGTGQEYYPSFWNYYHDDPLIIPPDYEQHREKTTRKLAEEHVRTQVPGSFYKNFRIEELAQDG